jgi:hypothetical protein
VFSDAGSKPGNRWRHRLRVTVNGYNYSIQGVTTQSGSQIVHAETNGYALPGSPSITFQQLNLETRVWRNAGTSCSLGQKLFREVNSKKYNVTSTQHDVSAPSSGFWYGISKHKLVDTRATNSDGDPPDVFYTEVSQSNTPSSKERYRGSGVGCP